MGTLTKWEEAFIKEDTERKAEEWEYIKKMRKSLINGWYYNPISKDYRFFCNVTSDNYICYQNISDVKKEELTLSKRFKSIHILDDKWFTDAEFVGDVTWSNLNLI